MGHIAAGHEVAPQWIPNPPVTHVIGSMAASDSPPSSLTARDEFSTRTERNIHQAAQTGTAVPAVRPALRLALILVGAFMVVLDFSIVNVALPSIERELGMSAFVAQWVVTGYAITFGGLLILGGRAADLLGRRRMFIAGMLAFSLASLAGGLARDPVLLIASRAI